MAKVRESEEDTTYTASYGAESPQRAFVANLLMLRAIASVSDCAWV